jgi:hypothetical protein
MATGRKSSTQRVLELEIEMTMHEPAKAGELRWVNPGASKAFTELHRYSGLLGVQALYDSGCTKPEDVWDFYCSCNKSVVVMARHLNLE